MYTMKQTCAQTGLSYETLKFYCNAGLVPNVKRDRNNHRIFSDRDIAWISSLDCLKRCGMGIADMKQYLTLCLGGAPTIPARKQILAQKRAALCAQMEQLQKSIDYIDWKQSFYDDVLSGKTPYFSNVLPEAD